MKLCNVVHEIFIEPIDQLRLFPDIESGETKVELHRISTSIPFYGVPDLVEVLGKMRPHSLPCNPSSSLSRTHSLVSRNFDLVVSCVRVLSLRTCYIPQAQLQFRTC